MSDFMTQKDLDAILEGRSPEGQPEEVIPYSFLKPPKITKQRWASVESIFESFASKLAGMLTLRLQSPVDALVTGIEQVVFGEFVLSLSTPCVSFLFGVGGRPDRHGVIDLSNQVSFFLLERLFGGLGDEEPPRRALTPLEETVVRGIAERAVEILRENWEEELEIARELSGFESDPDLLQIAERDENVLAAIVEIRAAEFRGYITLGFPMEVLEPILRTHIQTRTPARFRTEGDAKTNRARVETGIQHARLTISARLPTFLLSAGSLARLEVGQTIDSAHPIHTPVELHVNGRARFQGVIGQVQRQIGLQITDSVAGPASDRPGRSKEGRVL